MQISKLEYFMKLSILEQSLIYECVLSALVALVPLLGAMLPKLIARFFFFCGQQILLGGWLIKKNK